MNPPKRKGAKRMSEIPADVLARLNAGEIEAVTLVEWLAIDFAALFRAAFPEASESAHARMASLREEKITRKMQIAGQVLLEELSLADAYARFLPHRSDTVRSWVAVIVGQAPKLSLPQRLKRIEPLADDPNPGVREWAWMALRPHFAKDLPDAIERLRPWVRKKSANLRRFAVEALRPRGVWCAHLDILKQNPSLGLPLLEPLRADESKYVQDSVSNWLNDAAKTQGDFVREVCREWLSESPTKATQRICRRAQRSL